MHCSTTFDRIVQLYDRAGALLAQPDGLSADEQRQFAAIRAELGQLWPQRRAELVFDAAGPPRLVSSPEPLDKRRRTAFGIAPLPASGGD